MADLKQSNGLIDETKVLAAYDYYPFGMTARKIEFSTGYKFGYQDQEKIEELNGNYEFKYRMHDPRLGRFWSIDPLVRKYPWNSTYAFAENKLGIGVEFEGLELSLNNPLIQNPAIMMQYAFKVTGWISEKHQQGMRYVGLSNTANELNKKYNTGAPQFNYYDKSLLYMGAWFGLVANSDVNDPAVLMTGENLDGTKADKVDYTFAVAGLKAPLN